MRYNIGNNKEMWSNYKKHILRWIKSDGKLDDLYIDHVYPCLRVISTYQCDHCGFRLKSAIDINEWIESSIAYTASKLLISYDRRHTKGLFNYITLIVKTFFNRSINHAMTLKEKRFRALQSIDCLPHPHWESMAASGVIDEIEPLNHELTDYVIDYWRKNINRHFSMNCKTGKIANEIINFLEDSHALRGDLLADKNYGYMAVYHNYFIHKYGVTKQLVSNVFKKMAVVNKKLLANYRKPGVFT